MKLIMSALLSIAVISAGGFSAAARSGAAAPAQAPTSANTASTGNAAPPRRALLIGVGKYSSGEINPLDGPPNDVAVMEALLSNDRFGFTDIVKLQDTQATRAAILSALDALAQRTSAGDVVAVYYSGHGSVVPDQNADETDGLDETLVPYDAQPDGATDIRDDELGERLAAIANKSPYLTFISDSCHAGTNTRFTPMATRRFVERKLQPAAVTDASGLTDHLPTVAIIAGAQPDEYSYETTFEDGKSYGALTHALVGVLSSQNLTNYRALEDQVTARVLARFPRQHPRFEGGGLSRTIFGVTVVPTAPYLLVEPKSPTEVFVEGGAPSGLATDAQIQIFPPGTNDFSSTAAVTKATVTDVVGARAIARLDRTVAVAPHSRARIVAGAFGAKPVAVAVEASMPADLAARLHTEIAKVASLKLVEDQAELRVVAEAGFLGVVDMDGSLLTRTIETQDRCAAEDLALQLRDWAHWRAIAAFQNPAATLPVRLHLGRTVKRADMPPPDTATPGENMYLHVENSSSKDLWFVVLDLSSDGSIAAAYPKDGQAEKLNANSLTQAISASFTVPGGRAYVDDTLLVIAATEKFSGWTFVQDAIGSAKARTGAGSSQPPCVDSSAQELTAERAKSIRAVQTRVLSEWSTARLQLRIVAATPLLEEPRIALHFAAPTTAEAVRTKALARATLCVVPGQPSCAQVKALDTGNTVFAISADRLRARGPQGTASHSIGQAFSDAYTAAAELGADYGEPLLTLSLGEEDEELAGMRGGDGTDDPVARSDDRWNHRYALVPAAWALRRARGAVPGEEAAGVVIGHPDTGYTLHPENWLDAGARTGPLDLSHAWNYLDGTSDALDPRDKGLLKHPGHGTAASSVIISPAGCASGMQRERCVTGIAQGARLVPLRVHKSVVVFDSEHLVQALNDIASRKRGNISLVSLAMGGPPSRALHKAVQALERSGIPLLAAAGNQVKTVVWPARFDEAIAVTAINSRCELWNGASLGSAVDIAAPGESVWRATFDKNDAYDIAMGQGTTFATGTTAGIAALWLAHHRGPALDALVASGKVTGELRRALAETSWRPDSGVPDGVNCTNARAWRPRVYGAGIVNAHALLSRPLSNAASAPAPRGVLPLFSTLYPDGTPAARIESDYRGLFRDGVQPERFETEVLYQYTANDAVREALDELAGSTQATRDYARVVEALALVDLSPELRAALRAAP